MEPTGERLLRIGEVARLSGLDVGTPRNYEQRGLLKPAGRSKAGHRLYGIEEVARLRFIKRAKPLGLALTEIKELLDLAAAEDDRGKALTRLDEMLEARVLEIERQVLE